MKLVPKGLKDSARGFFNQVPTQKRPDPIGAVEGVTRRCVDDRDAETMSSACGPEARSEPVVTIDLDKVINQGVKAVFEREASGKRISSSARCERRSTRVGPWRRWRPTANRAGSP